LDLLCHVSRNKPGGQQVLQETLRGGEKCGNALFRKGGSKGAAVGKGGLTRLREILPRGNRCLAVACPRYRWKKCIIRGIKNAGRGGWKKKTYVRQGNVGGGNTSLKGEREPWGGCGRVAYRLS